MCTARSPEHLLEAWFNGPPIPTAVGVIAPYDMALDQEMWRWSPPGVDLLFTRTPYLPLPVTIEMAEQVSDATDVRNGVRSLGAVRPDVYAYACTSGSFVRGVEGERALRAEMLDAGAPLAVTAAGALVDALHDLGVSRLAVSTPYDAAVTGRLRTFLGEAGIDVVASSHLGLTAEIWKVPYSTTADLMLRSDSDDAQALFVSCTNLATYDLIAPMEARLGKPVISANQVMMWAALRAIGRTPVGPGQRLVDGRGVEAADGSGPDGGPAETGPGSRDEQDGGGSHASAGVPAASGQSA